MACQQGTLTFRTPGSVNFLGLADAPNVETSFPELIVFFSRLFALNTIGTLSFC